MAGGGGLGPGWLGMPEPVGKYELRAVLGQGSFGTVYLGYQRDLERALAIKELRPDLSRDPAYVDALRGEARVMAGIDSVNCVRVFDFLEVDGRALLVSEFVDGAPLAAVVAQAGQLTPEQALGVLKGGLSGLAAAHRAGVVHRDIKPANILVDRDGVSKLADFGQAGRAGAGLGGTPAYMSPEQARGEPVDERSDLYSAGVVLFELLTGALPYNASNPAAMMRMHATGPAPDPRGTDTKLPLPVAALVMRAMSMDPAQRPAGAPALLEELELAAAAGYGDDWESRASVRRLAEAAALALGLLGLGQVGAGAAGVGTTGVTTLGRARWAAAAGAGIVALALAGAALGRVAPFASPGGGSTTTLVSAFGPAASSPQASAAAAGSPGLPVFVAGPGGSLVERLTLVSPALVPLGFSYCDAFVCGNSDNVDCIGNSYVPGFGASIPISVSLSPPAGAHLEQALVAGGPAPGAATAVSLYDPRSGGSAGGTLLTARPAVSPDGRLVLEFAAPWRGDLAPHYNARLARYCGFSSAQRTAFAAKYGTSYANPFPVVTVLLRWSAGWQPGTTAGVSVDGRTRETAVTLLAAPRAPGRPPVLLQADSRWAATRIGTTTYGAAGTVPLAVASALDAVGAGVEPTAVGAELLRSGAWHAGGATDWAALLAYLGTRATAAEEDLPAAATNAIAGRVALTAVSDGPGREALVVISGYDPRHDVFTVIDPRAGSVHWTWDRLAVANPWVVAVDPVVKP